MKFTVLISILLATYTLADGASAPSAIKTLADNSGIDIKEYSYNSLQVYLVDSRDQCCDLGAKLYDTNAELICRFIGIAGTWEPQCADFDEKAIFVGTIKYEALKIEVEGNEK